MVEIKPYNIGLTRPLRTAMGVVRERRGFVLRIESEGAVGFGEAAPLPPFSQETFEDCERDLGRGLARLRDLGPAESLTQLPEDLCSSARCALEVGILDWMAKQADAPLHFLLGGDGLDMLPVSSLIGTLEEAHGALSAGHRLLKVKVGHRDLAEDVAFLESLVESLGGGALLRLDANGAFDLSGAEAFFDAVAHLPVESVEDPLGLEHLQDLKKLHRFEVGLGIDEGCRDSEALEFLFESKAADYLVIKPMWCGGFLQAHALGVAAAQNGIGVALSTALDGAIGRAACIQLAAALPSEALWPSGVDTGGWLLSDHGELKMEIQEGHLHLSMLSGLGVGGLE